MSPSPLAPAYHPASVVGTVLSLAALIQSSQPECGKSKRIPDPSTPPQGHICPPPGSHAMRHSFTDLVIPARGDAITRRSRQSGGEPALRLLPSRTVPRAVRHQLVGPGRPALGTFPIRKSIGGERPRGGGGKCHNKSMKQSRGPCFALQYSLPRSDTMQHGA